MSSLFMQPATGREALGSFLSNYTTARKLWQTHRGSACGREGLKVMGQWDIRRPGVA